MIPSSRRGKNLQLVAKEEEPGCPKKGKWPPRGTGMTVLTYPRSAPRGTGKAGENDQYSGARVWSHTQGLSKLRLDLGWGSGQPGSGVAIDWVTSRSSSSGTKARRRRDVQSGLREASYMVRPAWTSVATRDREC